MTGERELVLALELVTEGDLIFEEKGTGPAGLESLDFGPFSTESYRSAAKETLNLTITFSYHFIELNLIFIIN